MFGYVLFCFSLLFVSGAAITIPYHKRLTQRAENVCVGISITALALFGFMIFLSAGGIDLVVKGLEKLGMEVIYI